MAARGRLAMALSATVSAALGSVPSDWLLAQAPSSAFPATLHSSAGGRLTIGNSLIQREFTTAPDFACVSFRSLMASPPAEILRSVQPEALLQLDGITYHIGGLVLPKTGSSNCSAEACPEAARRGVFTDKATLGTMARNESAFNYVSHSSGHPTPRYAWTPGTRYAPEDVAWPARGISLAITFEAPSSAAAKHQQLEVIIHYELLSGAPVITKSLSVRPKSGILPSAVADVVVTGITVEYLAVTQPYSPLALYSYAPPTREATTYANSAYGGHDLIKSHGQGEAYNGMLWVEQDSAHGPVIAWQDDPAIGGKGSPGAPGAGEPLLNASYSYQRDRFGQQHLHPPPPSPHPPPPCPSNCTASCKIDASECANCTACGYCMNPGGRLVHGSNPGEVYPYFGNPCQRQSDCRQCTLDHTCTCSAIVSPAGESRSCCKANSAQDHGGERYSFGVALDPELPGTEGGVLESFKTIELVLDSTEKERTGLAVRKMKRLLAPASQENPIFMHLTASPTDTKAVEAAIDQMQVAGFEMIIFSFGSGFQIESTDETYIAKIKASIDYAKAHGNIEVGAYDLIAETRNPPNASWAEISPETGGHDGDACFASGWRDFLLAGVTRFINRTGLSAIETDGPYGGQPCASETHEHHKGLSDSVFRENILQARFYQQLKAAGLYIHAPDNYYYWGQSKSGMGYNENQYSLPRWLDLHISRAGMFDDTFFNPNTAGWMFVPLQPYHAGGNAAAFSPLGQHLKEFEFALAQYFGFGVMPCWRGSALFDDVASKAVIIRWVSFYKKHRAILSSDLVHLRRADNQGIDAILHVNPTLPTKGLAFVYNPMDEAVNDTFKIDLYYTGLSTVAKVRERDGTPAMMSLARDYTVQLQLNIAARNVTWFTFE